MSTTQSQKFELSDTQHVSALLGQSTNSHELSKVSSKLQLCDPLKRFTFEVKCHQIFLGPVELKLHNFIVKFTFNEHAKLGCSDQCIDIGCYRFACSDEKISLSLSSRRIDRFGFFTGDAHQPCILLVRLRGNVEAIKKALKIEVKNSRDASRSERKFKVLIFLLKPFDHSYPAGIIRKKFLYTNEAEPQYCFQSDMQEAIYSWLKSSRENTVVRKLKFPTISRLPWLFINLILKDLGLFRGSSFCGTSFLYYSRKVADPNGKESDANADDASMEVEIQKSLNNLVFDDDLKTFASEWNLCLENVFAKQPSSFSQFSVRFLLKSDEAVDKRDSELRREEKLIEFIPEVKDYAAEQDEFILPKPVSDHDKDSVQGQEACRRSAEPEKKTSVFTKKRKLEPADTLVVEENDEEFLEEACQVTPFSSKSIVSASADGQRDVCPHPSSNLLTYPRLRSRDSVSLSLADLRVLADGEMLNDTVLEFYVKLVLHEKLSRDRANSVHVFNTFFFETLINDLSLASFKESSRAASLRFDSIGRNYRKLKRWTRKVDIFSKEFVVIPVHADAHWSVIIIVRPGLAITEQEIPLEVITRHRRKGAFDPDKECQSFIFVLDSLIDPQNDKCEAFADIVKDYLEYELEDKKQLHRHLDRLALKVVRPVRLPRQKNYIDCGVYAAAFVESFLCDPPDFEEITPYFDWAAKYPFFEKVTMKFMRDKIILAIKNKTTPENWNLLEVYESHTGKGVTFDTTDSLVERARRPRRHSVGHGDDIDRHLFIRCSSEPPDNRKCSPPMGYYNSQNFESWAFSRYSQAYESYC